MLHHTNGDLSPAERLHRILRVRLHSLKGNMGGAGACSDLVHNEGSDKQPHKGRREGSLQPCDPGGRDDNPHLCGQLQAQQVLRCSSEEEGRGVH